MALYFLPLLLLLLLLLLCSAPSAAALYNNSYSLTAGTNSSVWLSPSGVFAFGFYETPDGFALCIFVGRTVVWTPAKTLYPMLPTNSNRLLVSRNSMQLLETIDGDYDVYCQIAATRQTIFGWSMLDNGNFVLYNIEGIVIWQSFDYPTDTLLPGQRLTTGSELISRASQTDLSAGRFRLKMQRDGNLVQYPVETSDTAKNAYYTSDTYGAGNNLSLNLDNDGRLYLSNGSSITLNITSGGNPVAAGLTLYLARVDADGIFRLYVGSGSLNGEDDWRSIWWSTSDKCDPKGICGINSYCSYEEGNLNVTCTCLPGFGDGCKQVYDSRECRNMNSSVTYEIASIPNLTWEENYYAVNVTATAYDCGLMCLDDCDCVIALFRYNICYKQTFPMRYGRRTASDPRVALVRMSVPPPNSSGFGQQRHRNGLSHLPMSLTIGVSIGIAILVISSITIIIYLKRKCGFWSQDEESKENIDKCLLKHGSLAPKRYSYKEIKKITTSFAEKLGKGGFGIVYKGKLQDGQLVAVKVLTNNHIHNNADEFLNEVASISRTSHVNIVNLLGFCFERNRRALVYEFMPNKSLDIFIHKSCSVDAECSLEWSMLYDIAVGVARGLEYLHKGCNTRIVHFDIKPQNILLDQHFRPKISDFGLAKLCLKTQSVISMLGTRGTIGYIAPEVYSRNFGLVSHKSDVYSYGVMLLQMAETRTKVETMSYHSSEVYFLEKVYKHVLVKNEKVYAEIKEEEEVIVRKMLMVGFWCIQTAPSDRPSMNKVVDMLEGNLKSIQIPPLPFLLSSPKPQLSCLFPVSEETHCSSGA